MDGVFSPALTAGKCELVIRKEDSSPQSSAIQSGNYSDLFKVTTLNHLQITGFAALTTVSSEINQLDGLFQLILTKNALTSIPSEISALLKLKHLDLSQNQISLLPETLYGLHSLQTLIISHNALTDDSFPPTPDRTDLSTAFPSLHHVDILNNKLTKLPDFVYSTKCIQELIASDNEIDVVKPAISDLAGLKHIDLKRNKLKHLPNELSSCSKLRVMKFEENPLSDRRLLKLVTQHGSSKPKAVLDYIASHTPKSSAAPPASKGKKERSKTKTLVEKDDHEDDVVFSHSKTQITIVRPLKHIEVVASSLARSMRPYLVCAVVRAVNLTDDVAFKEFIMLQTKLHDTLCKRRRVATIATHNLDKISHPLRYSCQPADSITLTPLNWTNSVTALEFIRYLESSKQDKRGGGGGKGRGKGKKEQTAAETQDPVTTALSKYLQFVDPASMVFLQDSTETVISLPPLVNCEITKIDSDTADLFLEVTSSESLASCKQVMDQLVCGMCERELGVKDKVMSVEQVKVLDEDGHVLVLYPSRTDLIDTTFKVVRPQ